MREPPALDALFARWRQRVDDAIATALPDPATGPRHLHAAMRHAALLGGKRMRPLLVYATGAALGAGLDRLDPAATAVELIHAYSLVHDDLPAMDDDALRRGQPTVHVAFGEATAILAGDALQSLAFEQLARAALPAEMRIDMLAELATAAGAAGMCGGQALDIDATAPRPHSPTNSAGAPQRAAPQMDPRGTSSSAPQRAEDTRVQALLPPSVTLEYIERLHAMKTGALLRAAVRLGAIAAQADAPVRARLDTYAEALGLAFQVRDDLLDVEGDSATLGKTAGKDAAQAKITFPSLIGAEGSRETLRRLSAQMEEALAGFDDNADALRALARLVVERDR
jgi:farnesyl diphosphate synthase